MDRVRILAPTLVALVALLGEQGARIGAFVVPDIGLRWVLIAIAAGFLTAPKRDGRRLTARDAVVALAFAITFMGLALFRADALHPLLSIEVSFDDGRAVVADSWQLEARRDLRRLSGRRRNVTMRAEGLVELPASGEYRLDVDCDDSCALSLGETELRSSGVLTLERGEVPLALVYRQLRGPAHLRLAWNTPAAIELLPMEYFVRAPTEEPRRRGRAHASLALSMLWWALFSAWTARIAPYRVQIYDRRLVPSTAALCIILYGCLLRFDALVVHSGEDDVYLSHWLPSYSFFNPANAPDDPYRADVRSYLDRAETLSLTSFYAPSFREPFYIALTLPFLKLSGSEIGILIQSLFFSCATLVLFFFIATKLHGLWWATGLLVPVALHAWLILEAPTGYRMSAYAFFLLATVAVMFLTSSGGAAGALSGALTLIRLSALSVVVPLVALKAWALERKDRRRYAVVALALMAAIVAPFLISNTVEHADPFYAVSFHTEFWMRAEGLTASDGPVSLARYFTNFGRAGALVKGTFLGMTTLPVRTFWRGLQQFPVLDALTLGLGVAGLLLCVRTGERFLPAAYLCHLVPFAYIQNFPSGEMPRFVMPAYFFLVLAIPVAVRAVTERRKKRAPSPG